MGKRVATGKRRTVTTQIAAEPDGDRLHIRVPPDLKRAMKEVADDDSRTLSNWVLSVVREELRRRGKLN